VAGAVAKFLFWPNAHCIRQDRQNRDAVATGGEQHGNCAAGKSKYYRLYVDSGKSILAVMYLRQVRVVGFSFEAATAHISTVVTRPASAAQNLATFFCGILVISCFYRNL
jgi:hypothetical protein